MAEKRQPGTDLPTDIVVGDHGVGGLPPAQPAAPSLGRIVLYTNRAGVDMPAIVTEVTDPDTGLFVHLHLMPPPHQGVEHPDDLEWGFPHESQVLGEKIKCWRWPERA